MTSVESYIAFQPDPILHQILNEASKDYDPQTLCSIAVVCRKWGEDIAEVRSDCILRNIAQRFDCRHIMNTENLPTIEKLQQVYRLLNTKFLDLIREIRAVINLSETDNQTLLNKLTDWTSVLMQLFQENNFELCCRLLLFKPKFEKDLLFDHIAKHSNVFNCDKDNANIHKPYLRLILLCFGVKLPNINSLLKPKKLNELLLFTKILKPKHLTNCGYDWGKPNYEDQTLSSSSPLTVSPFFPLMEFINIIKNKEDLPFVEQFEISLPPTQSSIPPYFHPIIRTSVTGSEFCEILLDLAEEIVKSTGTPYISRELFEAFVSELPFEEPVHYLFLLKFIAKENKLLGVSDLLQEKCEELKILPRTSKNDESRDKVQCTGLFTFNI